MDLEEALLLIEDIHKRHITVSWRNKKRRYSIKCFLPLISRSGDLQDVEVLTCKKRNHYFSLKCYLADKSTYSNIVIHKSKDSRITKRKAINMQGHYRGLSDEETVEVANLISKFKLKCETAQ